jgi:glycosyltransferase involved in cell wall biosynthesis
MTALNIIWGFGIGGIGKCFLTYSALGSIDRRLTVHSACVQMSGDASDVTPLKDARVTVIQAKNLGDLSWMSTCKELIQVHKPDVIFTHGFNGVITMSLLCLRYGIKTPVVCSYHSEYHAPSWSRRFVALIYNAVVHALYRSSRVAAIMTVAEHNKRYLEKCGVQSNKITVVHNGIADVPLSSNDWSRLAPDLAIQPGEITIGILSRLDPVKGLDVLLESVAQLIRRDHKVRLVFVGEGPMRAILEEQSKRLGIEHAVGFVGFQTNAIDWLRVIDIFALPSFSEAHSIGLLEAMRAGKAIVATDVGGTPESVRNGIEALLVPPNNCEALSEGLERVIKDPYLRENLGKAARVRFMTEFTEDTMKRKLVEWLLNVA